MRNLLLGLLALLTPLIVVAAQAPAAPDAPPVVTASGKRAELSLGDAIILGVIEGVTEFLPVSSTGHLIIADKLLGLDSEEPLRGPDGQMLWHRKPKEGRPGEPLTIKLAASTYVVVIQVGAIAAVVLLYWSRLVSMLMGLFGRDPAGRRLLVNVLIAFVPAALIGFLANEWISEYLFSIGTVIFALVAGALLMFYAEYWYGKQVIAGTRVEREELSPMGAAGVGLLQCAALWPGTSRSMMTIVGGYFAGLGPQRAAEFSFILGFVTLSAASVYKGWKGGAAMIEVFGWQNVIIGGLVATVTAAICVRFLVTWLMRYGLAMFAWYRLVLALVLMLYFYVL
ncbi:MAG: undecaprenyl-diphosphate phosphatase [Opitutaceae bacterium]|nr:undecaprenyl-diphosphate phosphatase [Opitutaceae bacterium]